jgi:hypothetical protein
MERDFGQRRAFDIANNKREGRTLSVIVINNSSSSISPFYIIYYIKNANFYNLLERGYFEQ